jgi:hypothetical protein
VNELILMAHVLSGFNNPSEFGAAGSLANLLGDSARQNSYGPRAALDYVSTDLTRAALFVYQLKTSRSQPVKNRGLDRLRRYHVREVNLADCGVSKLAQDGQRIDGATLASKGLTPPCKKEFDSAVIELVADR